MLVAMKKHHSFAIYNEYTYKLIRPMNRPKSVAWVVGMVCWDPPYPCSSLTFSSIDPYGANKSSVDVSTTLIIRKMNGRPKALAIKTTFIFPNSFQNQQNEH